MDEPPKFVADRMLRRLARWLRLMGADVECSESIHGPAMLRMARNEQRIVLTRDQRLGTADDIVQIESNYFRDQLRQVLARVPFDPRPYAFSRCAYCNSLLRRVDRDVVRQSVPPYVYASNDEFAVCDGCGRIYWDATHPQRMRRELERLGL